MSGRLAAMEPIAPKSASIRVSIVVFPECDPSVIYGVFDTLWASGRFLNSIHNRPAEPLFEPRLVAASAEPLKLATGVTIVPQAGIDEVERTDVVFVPNVMLYTTACLRGLDRRLIAWIGRMHEAGAQIYATCGGSLVLAEAGLLSGGTATTHWSYVPLFRSNFPDVELQEDRILVQGGAGHSLVCGGGASSWQDLALYLIARNAGTDEAIRISKLFLYQWHREGQLPYASMIANVTHSDAAILRSQEWVARHYDHPDVVTGMAQRSGLPKRTFDRRFRVATGYSPLAYVQAMRIEEGKQMLETGEESVEEVAAQVGYEDTASFRRLFRRLVGMTPGDYRRKFQFPRGLLPAHQPRPVAVP